MTALLVTATLPVPGAGMNWDEHNEMGTFP